MMTHENLIIIINLSIKCYKVYRCWYTISWEMSSDQLYVQHDHHFVEIIGGMDQYF